MTQTLVLLPGLNNTRAVFDGVVAALPPPVAALALDNPALDTVAQRHQPHAGELRQRARALGQRPAGHGLSV